MTHTAPQTNVYRLWISLLAGPVIWSVYFLVGYGLAEVACRARFLTVRVMGFQLLSLVIVGLTIVAFLATLYAVFWTYRQWRRLKNEPGWRDEPGRFAEERSQFMIFAGMLLNSLFTLTILMTGVPVLLLQPCQWM